MPKKKPTDTPAKPPQFRTTPFGILKGVVAAAASPSPEPPAPVAAPPPRADDSVDLFLQAMDGVKPLDGSRQSMEKTPAAAPKRDAGSAGRTGAVPAHRDTAASELFLQEIGRLKLEVKFSESLPDEDELKPLSGNRLKQLKRGIISVDYQLDLHGLTRDEALAELPRFLRTARMKGQAAALVITGKGNHSPTEPVLQQAVTSWLRDAGRELVVEFSPAPREMGGSGAFVVFLRPAIQPASKPARQP
ncbi:MAG: Smr/MutS family protein [Geobacteraceae bacterium]|nr:Smr/MutS family protein [Geobacteraceae bacterium]